MEKDSDLYPLIISHVLKRIDLTEEEQRHFCSLLTIRRVLPRQYLVQQGEVCHHESYVCKGFLRSFYMDEKGNDYTLHFAMEDWWISDSTSFHLQVPAVRNIVDFGTAAAAAAHRILPGHYARLPEPDSEGKFEAGY